MIDRVYTVYQGSLNGNIVYIGTTIQKPSDRFRWHKHNGKNFTFKVLSQHDNADYMLSEELRLIKKHNPKHNKIKHRKQNLNCKLDTATLEGRRGDKEWCQGCLKRRVNAGYSKCSWC